MRYFGRASTSLVRIGEASRIGLHPVPKTPSLV
jgi:hypothetical protein